MRIRSLVDEINIGTGKPHFTYFYCCLTMPGDKKILVFLTIVIVLSTTTAACLLALSQHARPVEL